jgi:hypothetical protein
VVLAFDGDVDLAFDDEQYRFGVRVQLRRSLPPSGATSTMYCEKVSAKPVSGRAMTHMRILSQNGRWLVTMSRITPWG